MARIFRFLWGWLGRLLRLRISFRLPALGKMLAGVSILGLAFLSYLFGAATMHFQLPSSDFLSQAFEGGKAWHERGKITPSSDLFSPGQRRQGVVVDKASQTYSGFTLYTTTHGPRATLLDMRGRTVHQWELPFSRAWPHASHVSDPLPDEQIHWFRCHPYPNGDLLAIYQADGDTPYGYGLAKLNKDSKLLWTYSGRVHHDLDVGEDGTIYTLSQTVVRQAPAGLGYLPTPYLADSLVVLSSEGQELDNIPIAEAFRDSAYASQLRASIGEREVPRERPGSAPPLHSPDGTQSKRDHPRLAGLIKGDLFHTNSVRILSRSMATKFPLFKAGQVLISLRNTHTLAVLDRSERVVVWAARGMWRSQHDAEFLANGHLLLYDNLGAVKGCRILEYDPVTQAVPWVFSAAEGAPFTANFRGMKQRLPNGNTLIVDPENGRLLEATSDKEIVWECFCPRPITSAWRYGSHELAFLQEGPRARP